MNKKKEEQFCGCCCWFYAEDTYGYGCCPFQFGEVVECDKGCTQTKEFVSKKQMRHYMAVLLKYMRDKKAGCFNGEAKWPDQLDNPIEFAFKYMKIFSNL